MVSCSKKVFIWRPPICVAWLHRGVYNLEKSATSTFTMDICPVCLVLILCVGHLMRDSEVLFMGSWIECVRCLITVSWYLLYTDLCPPISLCVSHTRQLYLECPALTGRCIIYDEGIAHPTDGVHQSLSLNIFCVDITSSWCCCLLPSSEMYSWSNTFRRRACSGPANIHFLTAEGLSVNPTALPERFTRSLFCSCVWSICMLDNLSVVLRTTQLPCYSNSFWLGAGRLSMSRIWTGIHMSQFWRSSAKKHGTRAFGEFT